MVPDSRAPKPAERKAAAGQAFPKSARLLKRADFVRVYEEGRRLTLPDMAVFWRRRQEGAPRVGFTTPRALGGAVVRNRIRRRVREALRPQLGELRLAVDVVVNPRRSARTAEFPALQQQVAEAFASIVRGKGAPPRAKQPRMNAEK